METNNDNQEDTVTPVEEAVALAEASVVVADEVAGETTRIKNATIATR
jgi:hypothetical protein